MFRIEMLIGGRWIPVRPLTNGPPPYEFKTRAEAETLARVLFPVSMKEGRKDIKITEVANVC